MIDNVMNKIGSFLFWLTESVPAWWRSNLPKWFRFIFFYTTMIVWLPAMVAVIIPLAIVVGVIDLWRDFDD